MNRYQRDTGKEGVQNMETQNVDGETTPVKHNTSFDCNNRLDVEPFAIYTPPKVLYKPYRKFEYEQVPRKTGSTKRKRTDHGDECQIADMTLGRVAALVTTNWLREQIGSWKKGMELGRHVRLLDTSWKPDKDIDTYKEYYEPGHIPGSLFFDLNKCVEGTKFIPRNLPDSNCFADYAQSLGIYNNTHVIAYDRLNRRPSVRAWWMFRYYGHNKVSILDGGLSKWEADGFEVTTDIPTVEKSDFQPDINTDLLRDMKMMLKNLETRAEQVVDARGAAEYIGEEGDEGIKRGHIPGTSNIPFSTLFNEDGTFKTPEQLRHLFDEAGIDMAKPLTAMCQTGMTACGLAAAAHILGKTDVPVYYGSWKEWGQLADDNHIRTSL
ncbi:hypothetical protein ScPMuIL_014245 [Solemya velum]